MSYLHGCDIIVGDAPDATKMVAQAQLQKNGDIHGGVYLIALLLGAMASLATLVEFAWFMKRGRR